MEQITIQLGNGKGRMIGKCKLDCMTSIHAKELCDMHYRRLIRKGTTDKTKKKVWNKGLRGICRVENCNEPHQSLGYCNTHGLRIRKYGTTELPKKELKKCSMLNCENKYHGKGYCALHLSRIKRENNPQSNRSGSLELQIAMNYVRLRDKNHCQWYGCDKQGKGIHVHHIFPKSEYPELQLIQNYMICYCKVHHAKFHEMRGDDFYNFVKRGKN